MANNWWNPPAYGPVYNPPKLNYYNPTPTNTANSWYWQGGTAPKKFNVPAQYQNPNPPNMVNKGVFASGIWNKLWTGIQNTFQVQPSQYRPGGTPSGKPAIKSSSNSSRGQASGAMPFPAYGPQQNLTRQQVQNNNTPSPWLEWLGKNGYSQFGAGFYAGQPGRTYTNGTTQPNTIQVVAPGPGRAALPSQGAQPTDTGAGYGSGYGSGGGNQYNNYYGGGGGGGGYSYTPAAAQWYQAMTNWRV